MIEYIGLAIGFLGLVMSIIFCAAGIKRIGGSLSDPVTDRSRNYSPVPWRSEAGNFIWGVVLAFAFGATGLVISMSRF